MKEETYRSPTKHRRRGRKPEQKWRKNGSKRRRRLPALIRVRYQFRAEGKERCEDGRQLRGEGGEEGGECCGGVGCSCRGEKKGGLE
jgi:hypothetical protein